MSLERMRIMDNLEKVELLRAKTGVSYEEAKNALEACDYDALDALIYLEKLGQINNPGVASYTTASDRKSEEFELAQANYEKSCKGKTIGDAINGFFDWCGRIIRKGCETTFEVTRHGKKLVVVPVIVLVLCILFAFWVILPLLIVGMFMDCKYRFIGFESTSIDINDVCDKASNACENLKNDIKSGKDE